MSTPENPLVMPPPSKLPFAAKAVIGGIRLWLNTAGRVAPASLGQYCWKLYFSPRRTPVPAREQRALATAETFTFPYTTPSPTTPYPGGDLTGWSWGSGPTVVIAHGWESRGAWLAHAYVEPLVKAGYRVVTFDAPGHGVSPGTFSDVGHFAEALRALQAKIGDFHAVIGHSLGAAATAIALDRGLQAGRVAALGPAVWMLSFPARFCATFGPPKSVQDAFYERLFQTFPRSEWVAGSMDAVAPRMRVPVLIVQDDDDTEMHPQGAEAVARAWSGARLVKTKRLGHWAVGWSPEVVPQVVEFVTAAEAASAGA